MTQLSELTYAGIVAASKTRPLTPEERRFLVELPLPGSGKIYAHVRGAGGIAVAEPVLDKYGRRVGLRAVSLRGSGEL